MWTFASLIELCDVIDDSPTVGVLVALKLFGRENYVACRCSYAAANQPRCTKLHVKIVH